MKQFEQIKEELFDGEVFRNDLNENLYEEEKEIFGY